MITKITINHNEYLNTMMKVFLLSVVAFIVVLFMKESDIKEIKPKQ